MDDSSFPDYNIPLYVPAASVSLYKNKAPWSNFKTILKIGSSFLKGDVNEDGVVSITDAVSVVNIILNNGSSSAPALQKDDVEVVPE